MSDEKSDPRQMNEDQADPAKPGTSTPDADPAALAAGIRRALDDEALSFRISAMARSEAAGYTWESRAKRIREVLDRLPGQQRPKDA